MQRFALKLEDRVDRVADTLGQLQVAWTATLTAPALQSLGANAPALRELVFVEHAAITGDMVLIACCGDRGIPLVSVCMECSCDIVE